MDLVHENNGFDPHSAAVLSLGHHVLDLFDTAGNSAEIDELGMCFVSDNAGQGCLPHSRRSPKDHGRDLILLYELAKKLPLPQKMLLSHKSIQILRPQPAGQGVVYFTVVKQRHLLHHDHALLPESIHYRSMKTKFILA